jgi:predicted nucleic acid-binding protein
LSSQRPRPDALRAEAIHVGCALVIAARLSHIGIEFWTADKLQAQAAQKEGLTVRLVT